MENKENNGEIDCLFVIGTFLTTGLSNNIVDRAKYKDLLLIEINLTNVILNGNQNYFI